MRLEAERRFCGNDSEVLTGQDVEMTEKDGLATLLDPRTANCMHLTERGVDIKRFKERLKEEYVKFGLRAYQWRTREKPPPESDPESDEDSETKVKERKERQTEMAVELWDSEVDEEEVAAPEKLPSKPKAPKLSLADKIAAEMREVKNSLQTSFSHHHKAYVQQANSIPWRSLNGYGVTVPKERELTWKDLWDVDMGTVMREYFFKVDKDESKFGCLPKMAIASEGMMCAVMAASFCERVNSCANLIVTEGNSLLSKEEIDKLTVLRMNKDFMKLMRKNYPEVINSSHAKLGSVVRSEDSREEKEAPDDQPKSVDMG